MEKALYILELTPGDLKPISGFLALSGTSSAMITRSITLRAASHVHVVRRRASTVLLAQSVSRKSVGFVAGSIVTVRALLAAGVIFLSCFVTTTSVFALHDFKVLKY